MDFIINNKTYVIYVPEDKKGYLYLVNKRTGKVDFRLSYSAAEALFGPNLKDIKDKEIGLEKKKNALESIKIERKPESVKRLRAESVVAIWSNFKRRIMTPGGLTDVESKNGIQENPNAGPAMNKLYDTIVSITGNVQTITAYSKKWFGETGNKKDSDANYKLTEDILESMRLFTSFYTIGKRQHGAKDNPFKYVDGVMDFGENIDKLEGLIKKIKTASGAEFKAGLNIMDGLQYYFSHKGKLRRVVYTDGGRRTIQPAGRNVEKVEGLPQREDGTREFPFSLATYKDVIKKIKAGEAPNLKNKIFFVKDESGVKPYKDAIPQIKGMTKDNPFTSLEEYGIFLASTNPRKRANKTYFVRWEEKDGEIYKFTFDERGGDVGYGVPVQESFKEKREKLLSEAIFKKLVR